MIVRETSSFYDLSETKMLISGGDGNQWVRHSLIAWAFNKRLCWIGSIFTGSKANFS
jgi:hypothetical protein